MTFEKSVSSMFRMFNINIYKYIYNVYLIFVCL